MYMIYNYMHLVKNAPPEQAANNRDSLAKLLYTERLEIQFLDELSDTPDPNGGVSIRLVTRIGEKGRLGGIRLFKGGL